MHAIIFFSNCQTFLASLILRTRESRRESAISCVRLKNTPEDIEKAQSGFQLFKAMMPINAGEISQETFKSNLKTTLADPNYQLHFLYDTVTPSLPVALIGFSIKSSFYDGICIDIDSFSILEKYRNTAIMKNVIKLLHEQGTLSGSKKLEWSLFYEENAYILDLVSQCGLNPEEGKQFSISINKLKSL